MEVYVDNYLFGIQCKELDNEQLYNDCILLESNLNKIFELKHILPNTNDVSSYGLFSTGNHKNYNFFSYHTIEISKFFQLLKTKIKPFLPSEFQYVIKCWFNVFRKNEFIDWHTHWANRYKVVHGYYCVYVEDSITSYQIPIKNEITNFNVNNRDGLLVFGKSDGDKHRSSKWEHDKPRITIAFDIIPLTDLYLKEKMNVLNNPENYYDEHLIVF